MDGKYEFVSPEWDEISDHAKDMVGGVRTCSTCYICMGRDITERKIFCR